MKFDAQSVVDWLNQNQGLVAVAIFTLGIVGFLIKKLFFPDAGRSIIQKQKSGKDTLNIQSGRDTNYGNK